MRELHLTHWSQPSLDVTWDPESGALSGPGAERLRWLIRHFGTQVPLTPTGPDYPLSDPLRSPEQLAVLLTTQGFELPDDLAALAASAISKAGIEVPEDAIA